MSKHSGHTLPGVEVKDADGFIGAAGGHVLTRGIDLNLPHPTQKSLLVSLSIYVCIYIYTDRKKKGVSTVEKNVTLSRLPSSLKDPL